MSSIREQDRSSREGKGQRTNPNTLKMVNTCFVFLFYLLIKSPSVYINNHTSVWGSWYDASSGTWGYACCHSVIHVSYCAGKAGIDAAEATTAQHLLAAPPVAPLDVPVPDGDVEGKTKIEQNYSKKRVGEGDVKLDKERLATALADQKKRKGRGDDEDKNGKRRKAVLETSTHEVTEEELGKSLWYGDFMCAYSARRGISDAPTHDRGSNGQLCRRGTLIFFSFLYSMI